MNRTRKLTASFPNRYNFSEGTSGYYISNGGNNMYEYGNFISIMDVPELSYSDNQLTAEPALGEEGQYFTRKYLAYLFLRQISVN